MVTVAIAVPSCCFRENAPEQMKEHNNIGAAMELNVQAKVQALLGGWRQGQGQDPGAAHGVLPGVQAVCNGETWQCTPDHRGLVFILCGTVLYGTMPKTIW